MKYFVELLLSMKLNNYAEHHFIIYFSLEHVKNVRNENIGDNFRVASKLVSSYEPRFSNASIESYQKKSAISNDNTAYSILPHTTSFLIIKSNTWINSNLCHTTRVRPFYARDDK